MLVGRVVEFGMHFFFFLSGPSRPERADLPTKFSFKLADGTYRLVTSREFLPAHDS